MTIVPLVVALMLALAPTAVVLTGSNVAYWRFIYRARDLSQTHLLIPTLILQKPHNSSLPSTSTTKPLLIFPTLHTHQSETRTDQPPKREMPFVNPGYTYTDHTAPAGDGETSDPNPYNVLIFSCDNDPVKIQQRYLRHRETGAKEQRKRFLAPDFPGFNIDTILRLVLNEENGITNDGFVDTRFNLSIWARPTQSVTRLISNIQSRLREVIPDLWCMPLENLHMTSMEICHSRTKEEVQALERPIVHESKIAKEAVDTPFTMLREHGRRYRLLRPMIIYDATGIALSFVPAAGEISRFAAPQQDGEPVTLDHDRSTWHHLRSELWNMVSSDAACPPPSSMTASQYGKSHGVPVAARYVTPSAHLTIGRHVSQKSITVDGTEDGFIDRAKVALFVETIEQLNTWLRREAWPRIRAPAHIGGGQQITIQGPHHPPFFSKFLYNAPHSPSSDLPASANATDSETQSTDTISTSSDTTDGLAAGDVVDQFKWADNGGEWFVGHERGLELRSGACWYGGGYSCVFGREF